MESAEGKTASVPTDYELPPDAVKEANKGLIKTW
jgi:hypothetical protein